MITGGIDVGIKYTKIVIFNGNKIIAKKCGLSGGIDREKNVVALWSAVLEEAQLDEKDIDAVGVTGKGKYNVSFADVKKSELICVAKAAKYLQPEVTMVANLGADEILAAVLDKKAAITEYFQNQKCSAGLGLLLDHLAEEFDWDYEKISSLKGQSTVKVSDGCMVFARMDILEHMNRGARKEDVMLAVIRAAAVRACATINDITYPNTERFLLLGGLSKNRAFVDALSDRSGINFITDEMAEYGCALGMALYTAEWKKEDER